VISGYEFLIMLRILYVSRSYFRHSIYSDKAGRILCRVIEWDFFNFDIICVLFCFAVIVVANYMRGAHVSPVYFRVLIVFCDVSVFMTIIILNNIAFSKENFDVIYLIIDNQSMINQAIRLRRFYYV
jgi:hypothetical protein